MHTLFLSAVVIILLFFLYCVIEADKRYAKAQRARYILHPGYAKLANGTYTFMGLNDLIEIYGLNPGQDTILEYNRKTYLIQSNDVWLYPLNDGANCIKHLENILQSRNLKR